MPDLKLIALDDDDLAVVSAHLQDAIVRSGDMTFLKHDKRFAAVCNRFDWEAANATAGRKQATLARRRCGLRFERVLDAKVAGFDPSNKDAVLSLLAVSFEPRTAPAGYLTLLFSGGAAIRLEVECIEGEMKDLGAAWETARQPQHQDAADAGTPATGKR